MLEINTVGSTPVPGFQWLVGIAYIALPTDIERSIYIAECYKNGKVSVWTEDGGFLNRVPIDIDTLNYIEFPTVAKEFGSAVVYVTEQVHNQPIIVARLPKTNIVGGLKENQFKIQRRLGEKLIELSGSAQGNSLNLIVNSDNEEGSINIHLTNLNDNGELNIEVAGSIIVNAKEVEWIQKKRFFINTVGEDGQDKDNASFEQTNEESRFKNKKFVINNGNEPFLLGQKTIDFLEKFIDKVAAIQTITKLGLQPIVNKEDISFLKNELKNLTSKEAYLNQ